MGEKVKPKPAQVGGQVADFAELQLCLLAAAEQGSGCPIFQKFWFPEKSDKLCAAFKQIDTNRKRTEEACFIGFAVADIGSMACLWGNFKAGLL